MNTNNTNMTSTNNRVTEIIAMLDAEIFKLTAARNALAETPITTSIRKGREWIPDTKPKDTRLRKGRSSPLTPKGHIRGLSEKIIGVLSDTGWTRVSTIGSIINKAHFGGKFSDHDINRRIGNTLQYMRGSNKVVSRHIEGVRENEWALAKK